MHRFVWDLHYPPPPALSPNYPISAIDQDTWREPRGPVALPGRYELRLTVAGHTITRPLVVRMDPRVRATPAALAQQFAAAMRRDYDALQAVRALRAQIQAPLTDTLAAVERPLMRLNGDLAGLLDVIDGVDAAPTTQAARAVTTLEGKLTGLLARWDAIRRRATVR
jgi:hypothetical protein